MYEYRKLTPEERDTLVQQRLKRGFPPHAPPHPVKNQKNYLLTATCYEHKHYMQSEFRRQQVLDLVFEIFINRGIEIRAWVVLPNHYHLLVCLENLGIAGELFRSVHGPTARQWNIEDKIIGRKVWFRYSDRAIRSERHYYTTLNYIHYNPVKHGYVASPYDWSQSSVHWYLKHYGREWLRDLWVSYPIRDYGRKWDDL
jgi:putative transposase